MTFAPRIARPFCARPGATLSAGCTRIARPSGRSARRPARRRGPARRRQPRFGRRHARPAELRRPVRPARLVLCLAQHPPARLQHAAPVRRRPCSTSASTRPATSRACNRTGLELVVNINPEPRQDADARQPPQPVPGAVRQYRRRRPERPARPDHGQSAIAFPLPSYGRCSLPPVQGELGFIAPRAGGEHGQGHQVRRARRHRRDLDRLLHADQHRPDHRVAAKLAQQFGRDVGGLQPRHDQHVGGAGQAAERIDALHRRD